MASLRGNSNGDMLFSVDGPLRAGTGRQAGQAVQHRQKIAGDRAQRHCVRLNVAFGNNNQPYIRRNMLLMQADKFAQNPLDSIALRGVADFFGHSRSHLPDGRTLRFKADENDKIL